ncbi:MAG: DUF2235 domain-containing protein [Pseudomonadota bacterium]
MKSIIFCADGTWNGPDGDDDVDGVPDITNVLRLFLALEGQEAAADWRKSNEKEKVLTDAAGQTVQVAKYLYGAGDASNRLVQMLGGAFGAADISRIVRGYTFISRNYVPGDKIILVGFSRGAYTARALAGMIAAVGLLNPRPEMLRNKDFAYRLGCAAWYQYRHQAVSEVSPFLLSKLDALADDLPRFLSRELAPGDLRAVESVEAIAVWDTVGELGIPHFVGEDRRVGALRFADTRLSPKVAHAFQAIAIDELRVDFQPTLWDHEERIEQALFPGAHADVGGGYPRRDNESCLSDGALEWMVSRLKQIGLAFYPLQIAANHTAAEHQPWTRGKFKARPAVERVLPRPPVLKLHVSVARRWEAKSVLLEGAVPSLYRPMNLSAYLDSTGNPHAGVAVVG